MKYVVIELQNGAIGENSWVYEDINQAESKYHSILSVASVSAVDKHSAVILNELGYCVKSEGYDHATPPEPSNGGTEEVISE